MSRRATAAIITTDNLTIVFLRRCFYEFSRGSGMSRQATALIYTIQTRAITRRVNATIGANAVLCRAARFDNFRITYAHDYGTEGC